MRAVILAGGRGARLAPYTTVLPKPLMPVGGMPILEVLVRQLAQNGFDHITMTLGHLGKLIKVYFGDGREYRTDIDYSEESAPLGTMGPLKIVKNLPDDFLVLNGDILTDMSFSDFFRWHLKEGGIFSISSHKREVDTNLGVLETTPEGDLVAFQEKPKLPFEVSMGIYGVNRRILKEIPDHRPFGFDDLMVQLLASGKRPRVYRHDGFWLDIGRPEDFERAQSVFLEMKEGLLPLSRND